MLKVVMDPGEDEQVLDLVDTPEIVLMDFCYMIMKYRDLSNPDVQKILREFLNALKVKSEAEPTDYYAYDRRSMKEDIAEVEDLLDRLASNVE